MSVSLGRKENNHFRGVLVSLAAVLLVLPISQAIRQEQERQRWQEAQEWPIREAVYRAQVRRFPAERYYLTAQRSAQRIDPQWSARVLVVCDPDAGLVQRMQASHLSVALLSAAGNDPAMRRPRHEDCAVLSTTALWWVDGEKAVVCCGASYGVRASEAGVYTVRWLEGRWAVQSYRRRWVT